jgi:Uma2 family endonuclease
MPYDGWTTDDLDALPDDGIRRELVDGVLIVTPPPSFAHQNAVWRLCAALDPLLPPHLVVNQGCGVRINHKRAFVPDVLVAQRDAKPDPSHALRPQDVVLAVEIVAPTTVSLDRVLKPALYAGAGIGSYWRIEPTEDYRVHAYDRGARGVYAEVGEFDDRITVERPWPMEFDLAPIKPE